MIYPAPFLDYCARMGLKLTSLRKSVLFILWSAEKPLKAYELLYRLLQIKQNAKPPTVYRVLDYFVDFGVVHKVESIQSYTLCREPEKRYSFEILMVCNHCHQVNEFYDFNLHVLVQQIAQDHHFHLGQGAVELKGICDKCCAK